MVLDEVQSKLDVLRSNLEQLDRIPLGSLDEFSSDFRNVAASLYLLQTSIQALIDLGGFLVASKALPTPRTSQEVFERLEAAGLLPPGTASSVAPIVGFRNRIVHLYDRVDTKRVYEILTNHRRDLPRLLHLLLAIDDA
jgi:uncharacterized protein YutE (UPF0331/DUF86 family)